MSSDNYIKITKKTDNEYEVIKVTKDKDGSVNKKTYGSKDSLIFAKVIAKHGDKLNGEKLDKNTIVFKEPNTLIKYFNKEKTKGKKVHRPKSKIVRAGIVILAATFIALTAQTCSIQSDLEEAKPTEYESMTDYMQRYSESNTNNDYTKEENNKSYHKR